MIFLNFNYYLRS